MEIVTMMESGDWFVVAGTEYSETHKQTKGLWSTFIKLMPIVSMDATIGKSYIWNNNCNHKWAKSSFLVSHYDIISFHFRVFCFELEVVIKRQQKQQILKRKFILFRIVQTNPTFSSEK